MPYGQAVAARFPDPMVRYQTPGLADGRSAYTTNAELAQSNQRLAAEVDDLRQGLEMVEERARADLGMVKPDEILVQYAPRR